MLVALYTGEKCGGTVVAGPKLVLSKPSWSNSSRFASKDTANCKLILRIVNALVPDKIEVTKKSELIGGKERRVESEDCNKIFKSNNFFGLILFITILAEKLI